MAKRDVKTVNSFRGLVTRRSLRVEPGLIVFSQHKIIKGLMRPDVIADIRPSDPLRGTTPSPSNPPRWRVFL
jgi:hypothetical protein